MNAKLLVVIDNVTKRVVSLQLPAVLGRSREADITVPHPLISRRHCEISEANGLLLLRDLTSLNGTMIGGRRIEFAALLPDGEFTIGPITFRVVYQYDGDLESVPETRFVDGAEEPAEAGLGGPTPPEGEDESLEILPVVPATESVTGDFLTPDLMALADADPEQALPAVPAHPAPAPQAASTAPTGAKDAIGRQRPPVSNNKVPKPPVTSALDDPLEVDSSLQSGGLGRESPWSSELPALEKALRAPISPAAKALSTWPEPPASASSAEKAAKLAPKANPPAKEKPPVADPAAADPARMPGSSDDLDPEFGNFLEGLE